MKKIDSFTVEKVEQISDSIIIIFAKVDSENQSYDIEINGSSKIGFLALPPKDLEFLLRANDVALSKNLIKFLKKVVENEEFHLPVNLFSESTEPRKSRPRQPQAA